MNAPPETVDRGARSTVALAALALLGLVLFIGLIGLGTWQVYRRAWKLDLIARVDQRVHAPPLDPPGPAQWPDVTTASDEYRHVRVNGTLLNDKETRVQASTELGSGFWLITPLRMADGHVVLINRGFISPRWEHDKASDTMHPVTIIGLLRLKREKGKG